MSPSENHLIELLPRIERMRFLSVCEAVDLSPAQVLCEAGIPMRHVYFPNEGCISLVAAVDGRAGLEVGMVGHDGMIGSHQIFGVNIAPLQALVQGTGLAWRVDHRVFRNQLVQSVALQRVMGRYAYVTLSQFALSMGCQRFHGLGARVARWLLMRHDRSQSDSFLVTQECLGHMLGVRRVGVTLAAGALQSQGFIGYGRGMMTILDRCGLEGAACSCYARDRALYVEFLPVRKDSARRVNPH